MEVNLYINLLQKRSSFQLFIICSLKAILIKLFLVSRGVKMNQNANQDKMKDVFRKKYHTDIVPMLAKYEKIRKDKLCQMICFESIFLIAILFFLLKNTYPVAIVIFVVALLYLAVVSSNFVRDLKKECMPIVMNAIGSIKWTLNERIISDETISDSTLFNRYNGRRDDDGFIGIYKGVEFVISETNLTFTSGSGKNRQTRTVFNGVMINFKSNKEIKNATVIMPKKNVKVQQSLGWISIIVLVLFVVLMGLKLVSLSSFLNILCVSLPLVLFTVLKKKTNKGEVLNEMNLEDPVFSQKFVAYSSDQVEGRYLMTTAFIERFNSIIKAFRTDDVKCSFFGDNIMIAVSDTKNFFEIGNLFTSLNDSKSMDKFFDELTSIMFLIDHFKLNEKSGL